ncbi:MAG: hypothetical protein QXI71_04840 [Candidatus Bathyarchaeia archaeon]
MSKFPSQLFWVGEQSGRPILKYRKKDYVMDSTVNYYGRRKIKLSYEPGRLFLDSGAFTAAMRNIELDRERVLYIQERLRPDLAIPLDYPFTPNMSVDMMKLAWWKTRKNILYWQENSSLSGKVVPTLHSWDHQSLENNIKWIAKYIDASYLAIGVIVNPDFSGYKGFFKDRQPRIDLVRMLAQTVHLVSSLTDFKIHAMGLGSSPLILHLAYYLGVESTDSAGYRRKAAYGKIILPGTSERYVGSINGSFGRKRLNRQESLILEECECSVCRVNHTRLWYDWKARAIHNEFVLKLEATKARQLISQGIDAYEKYLDEIFSKSKHGLEYLWRRAKIMRKYHKITHL